MGLCIKLSSKKTSSTAKCLRVIDGWQLKQRAKPFYEKYDFFNTNQVHFYEVTKFMYYCAHRLQPSIFDDYHKFVTNVSRHERWSQRHKARGQGQGHQKNPRPWPRTAQPRTDPLEARDRDARGQGNDQGQKSASALQKKKGLQKIFSGDLQINSHLMDRDSTKTSHSPSRIIW